MRGYILELERDKTNKMTCAPREDSAHSDQSSSMPAWRNGFISNNGLLVRAITDILFYIDLIGTMVEIN